MKFSLQEMIRYTTGEAEMRVKTASAEVSPEKKEDKKKRPPAETPPENSATQPERNEDNMHTEGGEKVSSAYVEKLASAAEYLNTELWKIGGAPITSPVGPGKGPNTLPTDADSPTPGTQSTNTGEAKNFKVPLTTPPDSKSPGQVNPATAMQTDMNDRPGGEEDWRAKEPLAEKSGVAKVAARMRVMSIMNKMAEDGGGASNQAAHHENLPAFSEAEKDVPSIPSAAAKQEKLIMDVAKAINFKKHDAKAPAVAQMSEVISEPAQRKATDPVLAENLDAARASGATKLSSVNKVAAAKVLLRKIAEEGEAADASPEQKEKAKKLQAMLLSKKEGSDPKAAPQEGEAKEKDSMWGDNENQPLGGGY